LVYATDGRHVYSLLPHDTSSADSCGILSWTSLDNGFDEHFERVSACEQVNDFEGVPDYADSLDFLSGIAAVELERADEPFDYGTGGLAEGLLLITTSGVWHENVGLVRLNGNIVDEALISDLEGIVGPFAEQLWRRLESLLLILSGNFSHVVIIILIFNIIY
jgi:hypothetical protein